MAKILKRDRYNVLFDALCNKLQYLSLKSLRTLHKALSYIFSTFLLSDTLHICHTRGQYIKLDTTKALKIKSLLSTFNIPDRRASALV